MTDSDDHPRWSDGAWRASVESWVHDAVAPGSMAVTGELTPLHVRPWSLLLRVPTTDGQVLFKANLPALAHEAVVLEELGRLMPGTVPELIVVDHERGWMLQRDAGTCLRAHHAPGETPIAGWAELLRLYASLQVAVSMRGDVSALIDAGVPDQRPHRLSEALHELATDEAALLVGRAGGLQPGPYERLQASLSDIQERIASLDAGPMPPSIQHDDLHDENALLTTDHRLVVIDWGDSVIGHPAASLLVPLLEAGKRIGASAVLDPRLMPMIQSWIAPWSNLIDPVAIAQEVPDALLAGAVHRALVWHRALPELTAHERARWQSELPRWIQRLLDLHAQS